MSADDFRAPRWLPGGHAQTIWPALYSRRFDGPAPVFRRERLGTPDDDFVDIDWLGTDREAPLVIVFHGLEGSSRSHYAQAFAAAARQRGWRFAMPHFRGCSGERNRAPRAYHSGDHEEVGWILARLRERHAGPRVAVGVSLGGNALLRFAEETGERAGAEVDAIAAVSAPLDLAAGGRAIGRGFSRQVYTRMFMRTMKRKALQQLVEHPALFDAARMRSARDLREFDDLYTGPLHGFGDADAYYARASAKDRLREIRIPALVLNARNDPFLPAAALPRADEVGDWVTLWQPAQGGHVGFVTGRWPGHVKAMPAAVLDWLAARLRAHEASAAPPEATPAAGGGE